MAPSTAELCTPRREYNGPNCALCGFEENSGNFVGNSGKLAENSGIATLTISDLAMLFFPGNYQGLDPLQLLRPVEQP